MSKTKIVIFPNNRDFFGAKLVHLPLIYELKKHYSPCEITVFTPFERNDIFVGPGLADQAIHYDKSGWKLSRELKKIAPDYIYNLRPESGTVMGALLFFRGARRISFYSRQAAFLCHHTVPNNTQIYRAFNFLNLAKSQFKVGNTQDFFIDHWGYKPEAAKDKAFRLMLVVGAGTGEWKRWGIDNFLKLSELVLAERPDTKIDYICGNEEKNYLPDIKSFIDTHSNNNGLVLHENPSPMDIVKMLSETHLVIGNDAGPTHLAQLCHVPFVSINSGHNEVVREHIHEWNRLDEITKVVMGEAGTDIKLIQPSRVFSEAQPLFKA